MPKIGKQETCTEKGNRHETGIAVSKDTEDAIHQNPESPDPIKIIPKLLVCALHRWKEER